MSSAATVAIPSGTTSVPIYAFNGNLIRETMSHTTPTVFVVDEDVNIRRSLEPLIRAKGWQLRICDSVREFLVEPRPSGAVCLILAFSSNAPSSLEAQKKIASECAEMPIVVVADYEDIPTTVQAMKAGAVDFLLKPFGEELLVAAISQALARSRAALDRRTEMLHLQNCYGSLTPREQQVMGLVVTGLLNKQVGGELGISEITVKAHRGQVMQKMRADSFAHLVNMASRLRLTRPAFAL